MLRLQLAAEKSARKKKINKRIMIIEKKKKRFQNSYFQKWKNDFVLADKMAAGRPTGAAFLKIRSELFTQVWDLKIGCSKVEIIERNLRKSHGDCWINEWFTFIISCLFELVVSGCPVAYSLIKRSWNNSRGFRCGTGQSMRKRPTGKIRKTEIAVAVRGKSISWH